MAVSSDGSEIAVIASPGSGPHITPQARIIVINTRTGKHATWRNAPAAPNATRYLVNEVSLSLTNRGRELVFVGAIIYCRARPSASCHHGHTQALALSLASRGGLLSSSRVLLGANWARTGTGISGAVASADGSTLTIVTVPGTPNSQPNAITVFQVQLITHRQHLIYQIRVPGGTPSDLVFFSPDASGRHFLISAGSSRHPAVGWIDHGKLIKLKPSHRWAFDETW